MLFRMKVQSPKEIELESQAVINWTETIHQTREFD